MACFCVWDILSFLISLQLLTNHPCALGSLVKNKNKKQFYRLAVEVKYADLQLWWMVELISKKCFGVIFNWNINVVILS